MRDALIAAACTLLALAAYGLVLLLLEPKGGVYFVTPWPDSETWRGQP
jgi:hypothetical protein